ncbi:hypothetical protein HAX54_020793 [Datura stramonium]|uniref:Tripeptidyl-peptidase II n=1 Tax=Datura stramonium TaxID=4076 RepID=A0ABS8S2Q8_DATST|nr:hypothetical protein [Datura stramonium]
MDAIVNKALEELCKECCKGGGSTSVRISNLWPKLKPYLSINGLVLCGNVKKAILSNLISIPGIEFESGEGVRYSCGGDIDLVKCSVEECERLDLKIVVAESMLDNFTRIHEVEVSKSKLGTQELKALHLRKRVLQRIAVERTKGITQCELTKEFGFKANNFFHIIKELEDLGLIVRHQVTVWTNETSNNGELKHKHTQTNMLYLSRYRKRLHSEQNLVIREGVLMVEDVSPGNSATNKFENAKWKVLAISDIKKDLGYQDASGHKEWRNKEVQYWGNNRMSTAQISSIDVSNTVNDTKTQTTGSSLCDLVPVKTSATETISPRCQAHKAYPSHKLRADCAREQREHWILEMLEEEKFLIKPELQRKLESLEKDRHTRMDKKTLERSLNKLQQKGLCKCLDFFFPAVTNFCENLKRVVVLHPSVYELSPALLVEIYERIRSFEREVRGKKFSKFEKGDALRAKLLHIYLWEYVNSPDSEDTSSSGKYSCDLRNDDNSCKLVDIGAAIEAMQLELFLQVLGSAQMHENVFEKCGYYLQHCDIPMKNYACLKDTQSTKELSLLIAHLQHLKLIRLVCGEHTVDATQVTQITLTHALELKPFSEEPFSSAARSSASPGPDSCHQVRRDFVLSNRKAVDEYWNTLAGPNLKAASNASPGSAVQERFHDRKQKRLCRSEGVLNSKWMVHPIKGKNNSSRKRKRLLGGKSSGHVKLRTSDVRPSDKSTCDTVDQFPDEQNAFLVSPGDIGGNSQINYAGDHREVHEGIEQFQKTEANRSLMKRSGLPSLKPTCRAIFSWTEDADRHMVIEFVRHQATLGPYSRYFKWASVKNLPASPDACKNRMNILKGCIQFRSALMTLCNVVSERYARHLQRRSLDCDECEEIVQHNASEEDVNQGVSDSRKHSREAVAEERWDDFDDGSIKVALDKVLECKKMAKLDVSTGVQSANDKSDLSINAERPEKSSNWVPKRCSHPLIDRNSVRRQPFESVAVANAAEILKLAFLTTSRSRLATTSLVETYKHYSKYELLDAFNFLKEKKLIESRANNAVVLSRKFFDSMFSSPFSIGTGGQAAKFSTWLHEREKEMINDGVDLPPDLQCGDILNLCGLLCSGELSIIPCLQAEGVGKEKDARTSKRKNNISEFCDGSRGKASRIGEGEARREKGFPDITLSLSRATFSSREAVEFFKNDNNQPLTQNGEENQVKIMSVLGSSSSASHLEGKTNVEETHENGSYGYTAVSSKELLWEAMAKSAEHLCSLSSKKESFAFNPELFRSLLLAIQKAGDQGLSMKEISMFVNVQGEKMLDVIVDILETFEQVFKVNAYDSVHVVDSSYRSKYFLSIVPATRQDSLVTPVGLSKEAALSKREATNAQKELCTNTKFQNSTNQEKPSEPSVERESTKRHDSLEFQTAKSHSCKPILPWIDGDGTVNNGVYTKLVSRALGIIMQKPGILEDNVINQMRGMNPQWSSWNTIHESKAYIKTTSLRESHEHFPSVKMQVSICASYYGIAGGTARGGSPGSRIAVYRVCKAYGCSGSEIMKAFDDAIADGVDIINLSFGQPAGAEFEFSKNPIAIGAFHAVQKGIFVVASAGNDGPSPESVVNVAPWIFTVAATTIDRNIETHIPLGRNMLIKGGGISFSNLKKSPVYLLADSLSVKIDSEFVFDGPASDCESDTLDAHKVKGKIIVCNHLDDDISLEERLDEVKNKGGIGFILSLPDDELITAPKIGSFPGAVITQGDGIKICSYINSTRNPVATILPTPEIAAPGTAILAAWSANNTDLTPSGQESPLFNIDSGTSISCAHVSAIVATLKSRNPTWSPSAIRSAIMTTGVATMSGPLNPGLVYETEITDYLQFLCSTGLSDESVSNMNYPSIAVSLSKVRETKKVTRTLTRIGDEESEYTATITTPDASRVELYQSKSRDEATDEGRLDENAVVLTLLLIESKVEGHGVYIVYMGAKGSSDDHLQLMSSIITRRKNAVVHSYERSFSGFAARLSDVEAQWIAQQPGVVSVFTDPVFQPHTTRSWDFLRDQYDLEYGLNQRVSMTRESVQSHRYGKENAPEVMISILPAATGNNLYMCPWWRIQCVSYEFTETS